MCNSYERVFDESIELADNAMLKVRPELFYEWDFEKNDELGLNIYKVTKGSGKKVWWICQKCKSLYYSTIKHRSVGRSCPYCSGQKVNNTNSLASNYPELAFEWHPTKNGNLTPHNVTCNTNKKIWWLGKCNHEWETNIANRTSKKQGCPYCSNHRVLKGFNDMWTTNPNLAKLLANPEDGYEYTQTSGKKLDWKCPECGEIIKNKTISNVKNHRLYCPKCSDGKSFPEKVMYNVLKQLNINFEWEKAFKWSENKRYDFYLLDYKMIIEVNGEQHYKNCGFESKGGRSVDEEKENDILKKELAMLNGIQYYIIIDASESNIDYIKRSIINSYLSNYFNFNNLNWYQINNDSLKSIVLKTIELWNNGNRVKEISNILNIGRTTVSRYLKRGNDSRLCMYNGKDENLIGRTLGIKRNYRKCIQMSLNDCYIKEWDYIKEASLKLSVNSGSISQCCKGKQKTAGGYKWMYKEDYDKLIHNQEAI